MTMQHCFYRDVLMRLFGSTATGRAGRRLLLLYVLLSICPGVAAQRSIGDEQLSSPLTAQTLHKIAYELYISSEPASTESKQALFFLNAATELDERANYILADMINIATQFTEENYFNVVQYMLTQYIDGENIDLEVTRRAIHYLLDKLNVRQRRAILLSALFNAAKEKSNVLASDLGTQYALLLAEKADYENALAFLIQAYDANPYNKLAFTKIVEIKRRTDEQLAPAIYARHFRLARGANPLDIEAAFAFARYMDTLGIYEVATAGYGYCAELFEYLYPNVNLPASIYLPWAIAAYNTTRGEIKCFQIARQVRQSGRFDIVLDAIAANAAGRMGDAERRKEFLQATVKAEKMLASGIASSHVTAHQLGWFYSFADPNPEKALAWANKAYAADPNSPMVKAIFAYTLVMNGQNELAAGMASDSQEINQIAALTMGLVKLGAGDKQGAVERLKAAVAMDPSSLAAERGKAVLQENESTYIPPNSPELVMRTLVSEFGERIVPRFTPVEKLISVKLTFGGSRFFYGSDFNAKLMLTNESPEPLIISSDGLFKGNIRVDADVRGDMTVTIPKLITKKIRLSTALPARRHVGIELDVITGSLRQLLLTHPQASFEIEFTVYLDPIEAPDGTVRSALPGIGQINAIVRRKGELLTSKYLMQRLDALSKGQEGQKIRTAQLFMGLVLEKDAMQRSRPAYQYMDVPRPLLIDAVNRSLRDESWAVRIQTMSTMLLATGSLDYELIKTVSESLSDSHWPVRLMTLYLLSKSQGPQFQQVLDWSVRYDTNSMVRNMAIAIGAEPPPQPKAVPEAQEQEP
jgi:hypothetical protein